MTASEAQALAYSLEIGGTDMAEARQWADAQIAATENPSDALLALATERNVADAVLGGLMLVFSLFALPMFLFLPFPEGHPSQPPRAFFLIFLFLYPLFGVLWGWLGGQISARLYNFAAKRLGGVSIELVPSDTAQA